jgi:hypothetical protein
MQWRFDPKTAVLVAVTSLLPFACSPSGGGGSGGSGGSNTGSGGGSGGSSTGSGGGSGGSSSGSGGAAAGSGGAGSGGSASGSGGAGAGTGGAISGSGGTPGSGGQTGSGGGQGGDKVGGKGGGKGGTSPGTGGRAGAGGAPPGSGGAAGGGAAGAAGCDEAHGYHLTPQGDACTNAPRVLCVFDYDLVLSSHSCAQTMAMPTEYLCRTNDCTTYAWHDQCLATAAHTAIAECVRHGAMIGIASHSAFDACFNDKVIETLTPAAFPEFYSSIHYNKTGTDFSYPAIDDRANWNCDTCAYHFDGMTKGSKAVLIRKVMAHYGLSPTSKADQSRVLYWEDDPAFIDDVHTNLPGAQVIAVTSTNPASNGAGCGIQPANVTAGWAALAASPP